MAGTARRQLDQRNHVRWPHGRDRQREELCWQSDKGCDYLELSIDLADGFRPRSTDSLAKKDAILVPHPMSYLRRSMPRRACDIPYLPWGRDVAWRPRRKLRDGVLVDQSRRARSIAIGGSSEWRSDPRRRNACRRTGTLTLTQGSHGERAPYCPLLIDLDRSDREGTHLAAIDRGRIALRRLARRSSRLPRNPVPINGSSTARSLRPATARSWARTFPASSRPAFPLPAKSSLGSRRK